MSSEFESYDTPKSLISLNYDLPRSAAGLTINNKLNKEKMEDANYDIPKSINFQQQQHHHQNQNLTPSSSNSSLLTSDSLSLSSSNRSSLANMPDYDIPRRNPQSVHHNHPHHAHSHQQQRSTPTPPSLHSSSSLNNQTYDIPQSQQSNHPHHHHNQQQHNKPIIPNKELPLELSSALETLAKLQNEATSAVTRLLSFVVPNWRTKEKLEPILMDLKLAVVRLRTALYDLTEFGDGALGNATKIDDKNLCLKLRPLVKALKDSNKLVNDSSEKMDHHGWLIESLIRVDTQQALPPDSLDQLIACAQTLTEDVRQTASFIQGNATLLFKRTLQSPQGNSNGSGEWLEDYDYVSLESKEASAKKNAEIRDVLPQDLQKKFDNAIRNAESAAINDKNELDTTDKSLIVYYATQTVTHMGYLTQAIDAFLQTVEHNQPPKFFIAYGKFVVLSAHNLINIGDIVHRNVSKQDVRARVLQCADSLSEALKTCVSKTKKAAQHFPSVTAVQEMVDSVVDISHLASDLKIAMLQAVPQ